MKVILNQVVPKVGKKDQVVNVANGFARNYLFPRGLATVATKNQVNALEKRLARMQGKIDAEKDSAEKIKEQIDGKVFEIEGKVAAGGKKLFGSFTPQNIVDLIKEECNIELEKKQVALLFPIRTLGSYRIQIDLHHHVDAFVTINIFDPVALAAEEAAKAEAAAKEAEEQGEEFADSAEEKADEATTE